jgi:hypothetical protein
MVDSGPVFSPWRVIKILFGCFAFLVGAFVALGFIGMWIAPAPAPKPPLSAHDMAATERAFAKAKGEMLSAKPLSATPRPAPKKDAARLRRGQGSERPHLVSMGETGLDLVAVDDGCYADMLKIVRLTGVEKRQKFLELLGSGCVFAVDAGTHVDATRREDGTYAVTIAEGPAKGRTGIAASVSFQ